MKHSLAAAMYAYAVAWRDSARTWASPGHPMEEVEENGEHAVREVHGIAVGRKKSTLARSTFAQPILLHLLGLAGASQETIQARGTKSKDGCINQMIFRSPR